VKCERNDRGRIVDTSATTYTRTNTDFSIFWNKTNLPDDHYFFIKVNFNKGSITHIIYELYIYLYFHTNTINIENSEHIFYYY